MHVKGDWQNIGFVSVYGSVGGETAVLKTGSTVSDV